MIDLDRVLAAQRNWQAAARAGESIAQSAANEALKKCAEAIAILSRNLKEIGCLWTYSESASYSTLERNIAIIENTIGSPIPQILTAFWEKVGGVSFVDLDSYQHVDFWVRQKITTPGRFCDGVHVDACRDEWAAFICAAFADWEEEKAAGETGSFLLSLSPDGYHKDNISGGAPYGIYVGRSWLPTWQNFEWVGTARPLTAPSEAPDFLSYLRTTILECAGFPGLLGVPGFNLIREHALRNVPIF